MMAETCRHHNLFRNTPAAQWVEGLPCGNGTLGAMAWGGPEELILSLGRSDLWHNSPDRPDRRITAGTLTIKCGAAGRFEEGLDLAEAVAFRQTGRHRIQWFVYAQAPVLCLRFVNPPAQLDFRWREPALWSPWATAVIRYGSLLGGHKPGKIANPYAGRSWGQRGVRNGLAFMRFAVDGQDHVYVGVRACQGGQTKAIRRSGSSFTVNAQTGRELLILVQVWSPERHPETGLAEALEDLAARTPADWTALLAGHRQWWQEFWSRSTVRLSNPVLERLWYRGVYHLGCNLRSDSVPPTLQGVWGEDGMPVSNGGYHWDLNVQTCYWPIYAGNRLEVGHSLYDWYLDKLPVFQAYARSQFGADGAVMPPSHGPGFVLHRKPGPEEFVCFGDNAWVDHNFWQHYQYTNNTEFLRTHCLPLWREHLKFARHLWRKGRDGRYHIRHAYSPELSFLATPACPCDDVAYEIALGRFLARAYLHAVRVLRLRSDDLSAWAKDFLRQVVDYPVAGPSRTNYYWPQDPRVSEFFVEWPGLQTQMSHRHHSHLMMIYPLGEIHRFSPRQSRQRAQNSIHMLILRGPGGWESFAFPWASLLATHAGWPRRMPVHMLEAFVKCAVIPANGLPVLADYLHLGISNQTSQFGPYHMENFTLEPSLIAVAAIQDMLLHAAGNCLVFGGGMPPDLDGSFEGFRSPFGDTVSGQFEQGELISAKIHSERTGVRRLALAKTPGYWTLKTAAGNRQWPNRSRITLTLARGERCSIKKR